MKAKINYKSRKTIIIIAIAVILVIAAIAGTVAFIKGNNNAAAAMPEDEQTTIGDAQNNNGGDANQNGGNPSENPSDNPQTELPAVDANNDGTTTEGNGATVTGDNGTTGTTTNGNGTGTTTGTTTGTAGTGATVPNQDYTQTTTVITENPWETKTIGWSPLSISAYTAAANLGINKPDLATEKLAYVQGDSLDKLPENTAIQKGEVITYVIKVTNKGNLDATSIRTIDTVPEGTELVEGSITANGTESNGKITWKTDIEAGKPVELSFQVKVVADSINLIENTAKVNGTETPTTQNPVITSDKQASVVIVKGVEEALEDRDAKVGETIRYTITAINKSEVDGTTIITDKVPTGTTYVADSASEGAVVADDGTITWEKVTVPAGEEVTVSFDVTVNKEIYNEETQQNESVKSVKNTATVGTIPTGEVETKVANITTTKASQPSATPLHELDTITYRLTATNSGNGTGTVTISDKIPEGTTLVGDVTVTGDTTKYDETQLKNGIAVEVKQSEAKTVTFTVRINVFKLGDANVTEENGKTIRTIDNLVATQDGETITPGTSDKVEKEYTSVKVTKSWNDANNADKTKPSSINVGLFVGGNKIDTKSLDANWEASFTKLDKYNSSNQLITYSVKELNSEGNPVNEGEMFDQYYQASYSKSTSGNTTTVTITNTLKYENVKTSVIAEKIWNDGTAKSREDSDTVTLKLYEDGVACKNANGAPVTGVASENSKWKVEFKDLQKYKTDGTPIKYTIKELNQNGNVVENNAMYDAHYKASYSADGLKVTNTIDYSTFKTSITVNKTWLEPAEVTTHSDVKLSLYQNDGTEAFRTGTISNGETSYVFTDLPIYDNTGNLYKYYVKEDKVEGYKEVAKQEVTGNSITIQNVIEQEYILISGTKTWEDAKEAHDPVTIQLFKNAETTPTTTTPTDVDGNYIFQSLAKYKVDANGNYEVDANGKVILNEYKVTEVPVDSYVTSPANGYSQITSTRTDCNFTNTMPSIEVTKNVTKIYDKDGVETQRTKVQAGDIIEYTIKVTNTGKIDLTDVTVTDDMRVNVSENSTGTQKNIYLTKANAQDGTNPTSTVISAITLTAAGTQNSTITRTVYYKVEAADVADATLKLTNVAKATGNYEDSNGNKKTVEDYSSENIENATTEIVANSEMNVTKTEKAKRKDANGEYTINLGANDKLLLGDKITYTITVTNTGNTDLTNVVVTDTMIITKNGKTATRIPTFNETEGVTISNNGTATTLTIAELPLSNKEITITATYIVTTADMSDTENKISNGVTGVSSETINNPVTPDPVEETTAIEYANITVNKVWDDNGNEPINSTDEKGSRPQEITIVFNGKYADGTTATTIEKTFTKPSNVINNTWTTSFNDLPKYGEKGEITYTVDEKEVPDWYVKSSVDTTTNTITNSIPRLNVTKEVYSLNGTPITPETGKEATASVKSGDVIGYKITVTNTGNIVLNNVTVTDVMTNGKTVYKEYDKDTKTLSAPISNNIVASGEQIAVNSSKEFIVYYKVDDADVKYVKDADGKDITIDNTATATESYKDGKGNDRVIESIDEASVGIAYSESITIKKEQEINGVKLDSTGKNKGEQVSVTPNTTIKYTITVENTGNTVQENVVVTDIMNNTPADVARSVTINSVKVNGISREYTFNNGNLTLKGTLNVDETAVIEAEYTVGENDMTTTAGKIENKVSVTTNTNPKDPTKPIEDVVEVPTEVWSTNIEVSKSSQLIKANTDSVVTVAEYGDTIKYTIKAENKGNKPGSIDITELIKTLITDQKVNLIEDLTTTNLSATQLNAIKEGNAINIPVDGKSSNSIYFEVTVVAKPGENLVNTVTLPDNTSVSDGGQQVEKAVTVLKQTEITTITNSNIVIVLDVSGSMASNSRLDNAITACKQLIDGIEFGVEGSNTGSQVAVVTFSSRYIYHESTKEWHETKSYEYGFWEQDENGNWRHGYWTGNDAYYEYPEEDNAETIGIAKTENDVEALEESIDALVANGGTRIAAGLKEAQEQIEALAEARPNNKNKVIVLSDGDFEIQKNTTDTLKDSAGETVSRVEEYAEALLESEAEPTVYAIAFGSDAINSNLNLLKDYIATSEDTYKEATDSLNSIINAFQQVSSDLVSATPEKVSSTNGIIQLENIDITKKVTLRVKGIKNTEFTPNEDFVENISQIKTDDGGKTYYLDLRDFAAGDTIEIDYFVTSAE